MELFITWLIVTAFLWADRELKSLTLLGLAFWFIPKIMVVGIIGLVVISMGWGFSRSRLIKKE